MEKPTFKQRLDGFARFLYNPEEKTVLGRGGKSWGEIGLFYLIYYTCLAGFFAATLAVFYETIDSDRPKLQGKSSLLKGNPGMGFKPMPDIDSTLIRSTKDPSMTEHIESMAKSIEKVLDKYKETPAESTNCDGLTEPRRDATTACQVNFKNLTGSCNAGNKYGTAEDKPCVLLKLNKIFGWVPEVWETKEEAIEAGLPEEITANYTNDRVWVYCHGENPADEDNIGLGEIKYYPMQGFPLAFYPYQKQEGYLAPLVFVQFENVVKHIGLMVECRAYAKNIKVDQQEKEGSVHFELLSDPQIKK